MSAVVVVVVRLFAWWASLLAPGAAVLSPAAGAASAAPVVAAALAAPALGSPGAEPGSEKYTHCQPVSASYKLI